MRAINIFGSIIFMVYGILLPAISTAVLNGLLIFINIFYLIKLLKLKNKNGEQVPESKNENGGGRK